MVSDECRVVRGRRDRSAEPSRNHDCHGDSAKKIWITEFGAPTSGTPDSVSEARQLEIYQAAMADKQTKSWLGPLIFYRLNDYAPYGATTDRESYFGAVRSDGTVKPSAAYVKSVLCP